MSAQSPDDLRDLLLASAQACREAMAIAEERDAFWWSHFNGILQATERMAVEWYAIAAEALEARAMPAWERTKRAVADRIRQTAKSLQAFRDEIAAVDASAGALLTKLVTDVTGAAKSSLPWVAVAAGLVLAAVVIVRVR